MSIRTQIYLSEDLYRQLKTRGEMFNKSLAEQVREAVEQYLSSGEKGHEPMADDPIWGIVGLAEGPEDLSSSHDKYLYGWKEKH